MDLKEFFKTTAVFDEDRYELLCDFSNEDIPEEEIVNDSYISITQRLYNEYECYTWAQIFNSIGIDILGKTKAIKFKELYCKTDRNENEEDELILLKNEILKEVFEHFDTAILVGNGILIANHDCLVDFEINEDDLAWKYDNWGNNDLDAEYSLSKEFKNTLISELFINGYYGDTD